MGLGRAIVSGFRNFFNFEGRATRSEYWWWIAFLAIFVPILGGCLFSAIFTTEAYNSMDTKYESLVMSFFLLLLTYPFYPMTVRRLHDAGFSGWFFGVLPIYLIWLQATAWLLKNATFHRSTREFLEVTLGIYALIGVFYSFVVFIFLFLPSEKDNKYGKNPLNS